eukprot:TRINITY_DN26346_c1_g1_i1.p1 TRINITY_DN26346_c1_g1~~TRINITY_DN26346_c1_g1_i1.p1  ORF type:complete len:897 (+),score=179.73 TRINITY_DN26346_c1_g1_i1:68-2692(+)
MSHDAGASTTAVAQRNEPGSLAGVKSGEPTQRFSALQQPLLTAGIHFFHRHIRSDPDVLQRMDGNAMFEYFFEVQYHGNKPDLNRIFPDSVHDSSPLHVASFILSILHQGIFSVSAFIVSIIYLSRFKESSRITLHACTWRPLFLTSLLLADKMWEDKPVRNSSLAKLFPVLNNTELNKLESEFLNELRFNVLVKPELFCSFCEKLLGEKSINSEIQRCVNRSEYVATLQTDSVEAPPLKQPAQQNQDNTQNLNGYDNNVAADANSITKASHHNIGGHGASVQAPNNTRSSLGSLSVSGQGAAPASMAPPSTADGGGGVVPRSQSCGTATGTRRTVHGTQLQQQLLQGHSRAGANPVGGGSSSVGVAAKSSTPTSSTQPSRSSSVHPLHRNESQKKHTVSKADEIAERSGLRQLQPPGVSQQGSVHGHGAVPLRRSLPAKSSVSAYAPASRVQVAGAGGTDLTSARRSFATLEAHRLAAAAAAAAGGGASGGASDAQGRVHGSTSVAPEVGSTSGSSGVPPAVRIGTLPLSGRTSTGPAPGPSPRSPHSALSPGRQEQASSLVAPAASGHQTPAAPGGALQYAHGHVTTPQMTRVYARSPSPGMHQPQMLTQPQQLLQPQQQHQQMLLQQQQQQQLAQQQQQQSAVPQEHDKGIQRQSVHGQAEQAAPSRASSAPRVSGLMGGYGGVHGHMAKGASHAAPAVGSTLRTPSQPMSQSMQTSPPHYSARQMVEKQRHTIGPEQRHTLGPGSPSQNSLTGIPPTSPQPMRGASPAPGQGMGMVTGSMNAARTHQPMSMSPGQFPFGGYRPEMPSGARGRSPPPAAGLQGGPGQARQPRAVTPGALVKGISQSIHGPPMQRQSLGGGGYSGMVHRGFG